MASKQHGVFTRAQALALGATKGMIQRRLDAGRWERLALGVYRLAGAAPSWRQTLLAACFAAGPGALASHRAAGVLWRVLDFESAIIELTIPRTRDRKGVGIVHRTSKMPAVDATVVDAIPVTALERTLIDLASVLSLDAFEEALDEARRRGLVSLSRLRWRIEAIGSQGRAGTRALQRMIDERRGEASVTKSKFEARFLRVMRAERLPKPVLQHPVRDNGRVVAVVDFAFPEQRLAIETDGRRFHTGRIPFERDRRRSNSLTLVGWRVIHVTWADLVERPREIAEAIRTALGIQRLRDKM